MSKAKGVDISSLKSLLEKDYMLQCFLCNAFVFCEETEGPTICQCIPPKDFASLLIDFNATLATSEKDFNKQLAAKLLYDKSEVEASIAKNSGDLKSGETADSLIAVLEVFCNNLDKKLHAQFGKKMKHAISNDKLISFIRGMDATTDPAAYLA